MAGANRQSTYSGVTVTPHDTNANVYEGFMVYTTAGDVAITTDLGSAITIKSVPLDTVIPIRTTLIKSTGTTAAGILGLRFISV